MSSIPLAELLDKCVPSQYVVQDFLELSPEEQLLKKDESEVVKAFLHIYECVGAGLGEKTILLCGELWHHLRVQYRRKKKHPVSLLMDHTEQISLMPVKIGGISPDPPISYPPSLN